MTDLLTYARTLDGIGAPSAEYAEIVGVDEHGASYDTASGCALVILHLLRRYGVQHPLLASPTRRQRGFSDVLTCASDLLCATDAPRIVRRGDVVVVGDLGPGDPLHGRAGGPGHMWLALETYEHGVVLGLDGGQRDDDGQQVIKLRLHQVLDGHDWAQSATDPGGGSRRVVRHVIDLEEMISG